MKTSLFSFSRKILIVRWFLLETAIVIENPIRRDACIRCTYAGCTYAPYYVSELRVQLSVVNRFTRHTQTLPFILTVYIDIGAFSSRAHHPFSYIICIIIICNNTMCARIISRSHNVCIIPNLFPERVSYNICYYMISATILYTRKYILLSSPARRVILLYRISRTRARVFLYYTSLIQFIYNALLCVCARANSDIIKLRATTCRTRSGSNKFNVTPAVYIGIDLHIYYNTGT